VLLGLPMASRDLCTKELCLGKGLNNLLSFGGRIHERISMLQFPFPPLFGGLQLMGREWDLGSCYRILLYKSRCYNFLLWETLADMQSQ